MSVRFRIRTPGGQELSFASVQMFEDFVRSGDLSPDDLVYDADDGSWAPARTHPIVLDIQYEEEEERASGGVEAGTVDAVQDGPDNAFGLSLAPAQDPPEPADAPHGAGASGRDGFGDAASSTGMRSAEDEGEAAAGASSGSDAHESDAADQAAAPADGADEGASFGLDLAMAKELTADEARAQFLERMQAERADEFEFGADVGIGDFRMETSASMADLVAPQPEAPAASPARASRPATPRPSSPRAEPARPAVAKSGGGAGRLLVGAVVVALLAVGGFVGMRLVGDRTEDASGIPDQPIEAIPVETAPDPPTREPVIAATEAAIRERARERFLTSTQNELRDLPPIPPRWPGGAYLALPSASPDIVATWEQYLTTVRRVREEEPDRYRVAYEAALDDAVIEGDARVARLEAGLARFAESADARSAHYDRVEALASAAIQSHNALLEAEGLLIFEGSGEGVAPGPLGAGVTARDEDSRLLLRQVVELLTATLEADGLGPGSGESVRAWVWDGFLDAATN